jgi:hypothetical protein
MQGGRKAAGEPGRHFQTEPGRSARGPAPGKFPDAGLIRPIPAPGFTEVSTIAHFDCWPGLLAWPHLFVLPFSCAPILLVGLLVGYM